MPTIHYCRKKWTCGLFNIAESTSALSHLGKQVIAISIIHRNIQWPRPQTILTSRLTEINGAPIQQLLHRFLPPDFICFSSLLLQSSVFLSTPISSSYSPCCFHLPRFVFIFLLSCRHLSVRNMRNSLTWTRVVKLCTWETRKGKRGWKSCLKRGNVFSFFAFVLLRHKKKTTDWRWTCFTVCCWTINIQEVLLNKAVRGFVFSED